MSRTEAKKYSRIVAALEEWQVLKGIPTYEEAVAQLADYLSVSYPSAFLAVKRVIWAFRLSLTQLSLKTRWTNAKIILKA